MTVATDRILLTSCLLTLAACAGPAGQSQIVAPKTAQPHDRPGLAAGKLGATSRDVQASHPEEAGPSPLTPRFQPGEGHEGGPTLEIDPTEGTAQTLLLDEPPRCPPDMALVLDRLCIDRWEASLVQDLPSGEEQPWSPYQSIDAATARLRAVSRAGVGPQGYISGVAAAGACAAAGKRLCAADEWTTACRGPKDTIYPYGSQHARRRCNDDGRALHPVAEVTERLHLPPDRMWYEGMDHPMINQLENTLQKTGERSDCTNDHGVFDMVGNLHEWTEDASGTFRGGYYMDTRKNGEGCNYATTAHSKSYHDYSTGFRCCMEADSVE